MSRKPVTRAIRVWMLAAGSVAALLLLACPAEASKLKLLVPSVTGFASDGSSYVVWQTSESSALTVLNTRAGRDRTIALPTGCRLVQRGEVSHWPSAVEGRFLLECKDAVTEPTGEPEGRIIDVRTGVSSPLPAGGSWFALGTRYVFGVASEPEPEGYVVASLTTGVVTRVGEGEYRNLDLPAHLASAASAPSCAVPSSAMKPALPWPTTRACSRGLPGCTATSG